MFALVVCFVGGLVWGVCYYLPLITVSWLVGRVGVRLVLAVLPLVCVAVLLPVLWHYTAHEVKEERGYVVFFVITAAPFLAGASFASRLMGISRRDDCLERGNGLAVVVYAAALLGMTCCYAGANVGEGETVWMTFGPAALAGAAYLLGWYLLATTTKVNDAVAVERDRRAAWRLAGYLIASGIVLGRSVAGDYVSGERTVEDFAAAGWPAVVLLVWAMIDQWRGARGWWGLAYMAGALVDLVVLGTWHLHMKGGGR